MSIHSYSPPTSLTVFSIANTHVRTSRSKKINKWYHNQSFLSSESGPECYSLHTCFRRQPVQCKVISITRTHVPWLGNFTSSPVLSGITFRNICTGWPAGSYLTWAIAKTSIFSKNNTEIEYKLNYSKQWWFFFFSTHKSLDYASSAKLKQKLKIMRVLLNYA